MAKKNLSSQQSNRLNQLSFALSDYIQAYHHIKYIQFLEEGNRKGIFALKDDIFNTLKCVYIPSLETEMVSYHQIQKYICDEYLNLVCIAKVKEKANKATLKQLADVTAVKIMFFELLDDANIDYD